MRSKEFHLLWEAIIELRTLVLIAHSPPSEEVFLTSNQVMMLLQISRSTLYRMRVSGAIPFVIINKRFFYPKSLLTQELLTRALSIQNKPDNK